MAQRDKTDPVLEATITIERLSEGPLRGKSVRCLQREKEEYMQRLSLMVALMVLWAMPAWAALESPADGDVKSGVGLIFGWVCEAETLEVSFNGGDRKVIPYGSERLDTKGACGDTDNGFGLLWNYNELGPGEQTLDFYVDGTLETTVNFIVRTLGDELFLRDVSGIGFIALSDGGVVQVRWDEATQGFRIFSYQQDEDIATLGQMIGGTWEFVGPPAFPFQLAYAFSYIVTAKFGVFVGGQALRDEEPIAVQINYLREPGLYIYQDEAETVGGNTYCLQYEFNLDSPDQVSGQVLAYESPHPPIPGVPPDMTPACGREVVAEYPFTGTRTPDLQP